MRIPPAYFRILATPLGGFLLLFSRPPAPVRPGPVPVPSLVVLISVDQLRGDYLQRYRDQWRGGFARLLARGAVFPNARQAHAITETGPGHATLLSGRDPARNGIVNNRLGVPDSAAPLVGTTVEGGASPWRFRGTTLVDWLRQRDSSTRFLSVSGKDRAAILPIGRSRGPVFWDAGGRFVTSRYYADALPPWVTAWNSRGSAEALAGRTWSLLLDQSAYPEADSQTFEHGGRDVTFPHRVPADPARAAEVALDYPWMDSITVDFALEGTRALGLGKRRGTDLLAISLSTTDYVGHTFGPDSRELHDQLLRLDRTLGRFLDSLDTLLGHSQPLVVLTADHGVTSFPEYAVAQGRPGGRISAGRFLATLSHRLPPRVAGSAQLEFDAGLLTANFDSLEASGLDPDSLSAAWAPALASIPGVSRVFTRATLAQSSDPVAKLWRRTLPDDFEWLLCASVSPGYIWADDSDYTTHGTSNPDDQSVPIAFMGAGIRPGLHSRAIETIDIAPTLAWLLGIEPGEKPDGQVVKEVGQKTRS